MDDAVNKRREAMHRRVHGAVEDAVQAVLASRYPMVGAAIVLTDEAGQAWTNMILSTNPKDGAVLFARTSSMAELVRKHIDAMRDEDTTEISGTSDLDEEED